MNTWRFKLLCRKKPYGALQLLEEERHYYLYGGKNLTSVFAFTNLSRVCPVWTKIMNYTTTVVRVVFLGFFPDISLAKCRMVYNVLSC